MTPPVPYLSPELCDLVRLLAEIAVDAYVAEHRAPNMASLDEGAIVEADTPQEVEL